MPNVSPPYRQGFYFRKYSDTRKAICFIQKQQSTLKWWFISCMPVCLSAWRIALLSSNVKVAQAKQQALKTLIRLLYDTLVPIFTEYLSFYHTTVPKLSYTSLSPYSQIRLINQKNSVIFFLFFQYQHMMQVPTSITKEEDSN